MMPGLINSIRPAGERGGFPKLFSDRHAEESTAPPATSLLPAPAAGAKAVRAFPMPASQAIRLQSRLNPMAEVAKAGMCGDQGLATEKIIPNHGSSGSNHDPSSICLVAMVKEFMENQCACEQNRCTHCFADGGCSNSTDDSPSNGAADMPRALQSLAYCTNDTEAMLLRDAHLIVDSITAEASHLCDDGRKATVTHGCLKRTVMNRLQKMGYNAAVCKTRWDHSCGTPAGEYEYIDVLVKGAARKRPERLLLDIDFQAQFEIARPTSEFSAAWQLLPPIFVGRPDRLKQIVHLMSEATKQSLRLKGLHLPPWRKLSYMKSKWFSPYKRTSNNDSAHPCREGEYPVKGGGGFAGIAVRGCGLDSRFTNELEMFYHDAGSKFLMRGGSNDALVVRSKRDEITVIATDWQPPAVAPRSAADSRKQGKVTGLASLLLQAGIPALSDETLARAG